MTDNEVRSLTERLASIKDSNSYRGSSYIAREEARQIEQKLEGLARSDMIYHQLKYGKS